MRKTVFTSIILVLAVALFAGSYAGDFMVIGSGVRALGLSGSFAATADDASAIYWNASGIAQIRQTEINLMRGYLYEGLATYDNLSIVQPLPNDVSIGVNWTRLSIEDIPYFPESALVGTVDQRAVFPWLNLSAIPESEFNSTDDLIQISFAKRIRYDVNLGWLFFRIPFDFHFGGNIKYIKRKIDSTLGTGTGFDFSTLFRTNLSDIFDYPWLGYLAYGMNFQDIGGTTVSWETSSQREDTVLMNTKLAAAYTQEILPLNSTWMISGDMDLIYGRTLHYGTEFTYADRAAIRMGYQNNRNEGQSNNFSAGASVKFYDFSVDYAFITSDLGNTNRIGLRVNF
ncbi:MAG: hypothetical protein R6U84_08095 [Candidatus Cloacimonadales bacterium]